MNPPAPVTQTVRPWPGRAGLAVSIGIVVFLPRKVVDACVCRLVIGTRIEVLSQKASCCVRQRTVLRTQWEEEQHIVVVLIEVRTLRSERERVV
jgi:hypothetical protein